MRRRRAAGPAQPFFGEEEEPLPPLGVRAGIDEAGLGPLLGPLAIGWSAFRVPVGTADLWTALAPAVTRELREREGLLVADSKLVFDRTEAGERRLESTALAFLSLPAPGRHPESGRALLEPGQEAEAWHAHLPARLPLFADPGELQARRTALVRALEAAGVEPLDLGARAVGVPRLNASFARSGSKARTHWEECLPVVTRMWERHGSEGVDLLVDRHGGRMRYGELLSAAFPAARVLRRMETPGRSEYFMHAAGRALRVAFAVRADGASFPVALASCLAKFLRETCMRGFNAYFGALDPALRPTAGYVTDGRRWLAEAAGAIERSGIRVAALVRER